MSRSETARTRWPDDALPKGARVDRYEVRELQAYSDLGVTYVAEDLALERPVELRELFPAFLTVRGPDGETIAPVSPAAAQDFEAGMAHFIAEARLLARFAHPSIAAVHDLFNENGTCYLARAHHEGLLLNNAVLESPLDGGEIEDLLPPVLDALEAIHTAGCLHGAMTPKTIRICWDGRPMLFHMGLDWPEAYLEDPDLSDVRAADFGGFDAPEKAGGTTGPGPWSDLYGLAATLYFAMTQQRPADAPARTAAAGDGGKDPLIPLRKAVPVGKYPRALIAAVDAALALDPALRPQDVASFRVLLESED